MKNNNLFLGKKVAVLVETEYISSEVQRYKQYFESLGAEVEFLSYLFGKSERVLVSDVTEEGILPDTMKVSRDISDADCNDYAVILIAANYVACRLREILPMGSLGSTSQLKEAPAVSFIIKAMQNKNIIKGALCHALWLMTPAPEILRGRKVVCHTVVLADVINAGAHFIGDYVSNDDTLNLSDDHHVVVDDDLVTGRSAADIEKYIQTIADTYEKKQRS